MTPLTYPVPPISDRYREQLHQLARTDFRALGHEEFLTDVGRFVQSVLDVAALLDVERPDWFTALDLDDLELDSECNCVLGQLYAPDETHVSPFSRGFAYLIRPRLLEQPDLQLGVSSYAPRSVWVAEVARRRELAGDTVITVRGATS